MSGKAAKARCNNLTITIHCIVIGLLALAIGANSKEFASYTYTFFLTSTMDDGEAKDRPGETGNAFSRIFTSCTSFVRSVTKRHKPGQAPARKRSQPGSTIKRSSSATRNRLQKTLSPSRNHKNSQPQETMAPTPLFNAIEDGRFWRLPDEELLILIRDEFPAELNRLKDAYSVRTTGIPHPKTRSISRILYDQDYDEINRTLIGVLALRWIKLDQYDNFIGSHPPSPVTLKRESFDWMRQIFTNGLKTPMDIYTLVLSMIINDLGKDHNLATDYAKLKNIDISNVNHDMILLHAVEAHMVPTLDLLPSAQRAQLVTGIKLGAEFNFGQLAQGENAPASLSGLQQLRGEDRAFEMRFMEQILDLSGASGHEDWTCARKMIEPIFQSYRNVFDAARAIISGEMDLRSAYDIIPARKLELLRTAGWEGEVDIRRPEGRTLARLFCMGNTNSRETADMYVKAFEEVLEETSRNTIIKGFNVDGSVDEPAIQPTYAPAMLSKATANTPTGTTEEKIQAISVVLTYLARCFEVTEEERMKFKEQRVMVIERDVRVIDKIVEGEEFKRDCWTALRGCRVPEGVAANVDRS
jgi:hypothetical protein